MVPLPCGTCVAFGVVLMLWTGVTAAGFGFGLGIEGLVVEAKCYAWKVRLTLCCVSRAASFTGLDLRYLGSGLYPWANRHAPVDRHLIRARAC